MSVTLRRLADAHTPSVWSSLAPALGGWPVPVRLAVGISRAMQWALKVLF